MAEKIEDLLGYHIDQRYEFDCTPAALWAAIDIMGIKSRPLASFVDSMQELAAYTGPEKPLVGLNLDYLRDEWDEFSRQNFPPREAPFTMVLPIVEDVPQAETFLEALTRDGNPVLLDYADPLRRGRRHAMVAFRFGSGSAGPVYRVVSPSEGTRDIPGRVLAASLSLSSPSVPRFPILGIQRRKV